MNNSVTEELLTASLGIHWEFSTMYVLGVAMLSVLCCAEPPVPRDHLGESWQDTWHR